MVCRHWQPWGCLSTTGRNLAMPILVWPGKPGLGCRCDLPRGQVSSTAVMALSRRLPGQGSSAVDWPRPTAPRDPGPWNAELPVFGPVADDQRAARRVTKARQQGFCASSRPRAVQTLSSQARVLPCLFLAERVSASRPSRDAEGRCSPWAARSELAMDLPGCRAKRYVVAPGLVSAVVPRPLHWRVGGCLAGRQKKRPMESQAPGTGDEAAWRRGRVEKRQRGEEATWRRGSVEKRPHGQEAAWTRRGSMSIPVVPAVGGVAASGGRCSVPHVIGRQLAWAVPCKCIRTRPSTACVCVMRRAAAPREHCKPTCRRASPREASTLRRCVPSLPFARPWADPRVRARTRVTRCPARPTSSARSTSCWAARRSSWPRPWSAAT